MLLRFIGEDGSMGLRKGKVYSCSVATQGYYVGIVWFDGGVNNASCFYHSFKKLFENWEEVGE